MQFTNVSKSLQFSFYSQLHQHAFSIELIFAQVQLHVVDITQT